MKSVRCKYTDLVAPKDLKPHPRNPNKHPVEQLELLGRIIVETGWRSPIVVSKRSGFIIKGHGRREAALMINLKSVPVDYQDYASDEAEISDLAMDNKLAEFSEIDTELLDRLLDELAETEEERFFLTAHHLDQFLDGRVDDSILDGMESTEEKQESLRLGVKRSMIFKCTEDQYDKLFGLVKFFRDRKIYVGGILMERLKEKVVAE